MTYRQTVNLSDEKFAEIYKNPKFRNEVAHAISYKGDKRKTVSYPIEYVCTAEQQEIAQAEVARAKREALDKLGNKLVFVGMGTTYEEDSIGNYRIRTTFKSKSGNEFFVEFSKSIRDDGTGVVHHAIDRTQEKYFENLYGKGLSIQWQSKYYNYRKLENSAVGYSKEGILRFVNTWFNCSFTEIEIDNYTLYCGEFVCLSPA